MQILIFAHEQELNIDFDSVRRGRSMTDRERQGEH